MSARSRGLGRGLDTLIGAAPTQQRAPIDAITPNPLQPRQAVDPTELDELAESIRTHGVLQPLLVRATGVGQFQLIAGERRWRAARLAGLDSVPIVEQSDVSDESEQLTLALTENIQRSDLNPLELARAFLQLADSGWTQQRIADQVGRSRAAVANLLRLLKLPDSVQELLASGVLSEGHGRALAGAPPAQQQALAERALSEGWTVRQLEGAVSADSERRDQSAKRRRTRASQPPFVERAAERWRDTLAAKVVVRVSRKGSGHSGQIVIPWRDEDELAALTTRISGDEPRSE